MTGFRVRLDALRDASEGVDGLLTNVRAAPLRARVPGPEAVGDARLAASVDAFLNRWQTGVDGLVRDGQAVAAFLRHSVAAYQDAEDAAVRGFAAGAGPDPAAAD